MTPAPTPFQFYPTTTNTTQTFSRWGTELSTLCICGWLTHQQTQDASLPTCAETYNASFITICQRVNIERDIIFLHVAQRAPPRDVALFEQLERLSDEAALNDAVICLQASELAAARVRLSPRASAAWSSSVHSLLLSFADSRWADASYCWITDQAKLVG